MGSLFLLMQIIANFTFRRIHLTLLFLILELIVISLLYNLNVNVEMLSRTLIKYHKNPTEALYNVLSFKFDNSHLSIQQMK